MDALEKHPKFNPQVKIKDLDEQKTEKIASAAVEQSADQSCDLVTMATESHDQADEDDGDDECSGFALFEQIAENPEQEESKLIMRVSQK